MFLDLNKIGPAGLAFDHRLKLPDLEEAAGGSVAVLEARLSGDVEKSDGDADLSAHLATTVRIACSRCLEPFAVGITADFFLRLVSGESEAGAVPARDYAEEEEALLFFCPEGRVDLLQMASEQIYLNLPLKPICREGCKGLCPDCGANRNVTDCDCRRGRAVDPRLAPLLPFKVRRRDET